MLGHLVVLWQALLLSGIAREWGWQASNIAGSKVECRQSIGVLAPLQSGGPGAAMDLF